MKHAIVILFLSAVAIPAGAATATGNAKASNTNAAPAQAAQGSSVHSGAASNLFLTLGERQLHCTKDSLTGLKDCLLRVKLEVDGPVRYEGNVVVACDAAFRLHYLGAYQPMVDSVERKISLHVKDGLGKGVVKLPVQHKVRSRMTSRTSLLKVHVDKLHCGINPKG